MARYRFRFLLQEFDLPAGETLIGRGPDCRITLTDPLVSRHHARIRFEAGRAVFEDLGSRNGSRINGRLVRGTQLLKHADCVRIGTQELVFTEVDSIPLANSAKDTGVLQHCAGCGMAYGTSVAVCPECGSRDVREENTLSGILDDRRRQNWALQVYLDMLRKALDLGREADAERIMVQAMAAIDERVKTTNSIDIGQLEALSKESVRLSLSQQSPKWARWMLEVYRRAAHVPPPSVVGALSEMPRRALQEMAETIRSLVHAAPVSLLSTEEQDGLSQLRTLVGSVGEG